MISIVIPLYNKEKSIKQTLDSVLRQDHTDFEIVVVDDGSTDNSPHIVREYMGKDNRIHLFTQKNGGPAKARNTGVGYANGDWILFLDADDELLPGALSTFSESINKHLRADIFVMEVLVTDGRVSRQAQVYQDGFIRYPFLAQCLGMLFMCSGSSIYRKSICLAIPFNEQYRRYEDLDRLFKLYEKYSLYTIHKLGGGVHTDYASASHARRDISEDFVGHINFRDKGFWERLALYSLFLGEREFYSSQCHQLYPHLYFRYDLLLFYKILGWMKGNKLCRKRLRHYIYK